MLHLVTGRRRFNCAGSSRRDFLKVGALGCGSLTLADLLRARAAAAEQNQSLPNTSVIWLWLGGGATHVETFDPKLTAPAEYRSVTGEVNTKLPGVTLGGTFPRIADVADKMAFVRSFAHGNSGHGGGTHFVMTGYDNRVVDNGGAVSRPALGAILARVRGANHPKSGLPTYVRLGGIGADGAAFLGKAYNPFDPAGQALKNMSLVVDAQRFGERRSLLSELDGINRAADGHGLMQGFDAFERQAFDMVLGSAHTAFDIRKEDPRVVENYGKGLGEQLLQARRLCEAGVGFVTVQYGGWDMHGNIKRGLESRSPQLDQAVAALVDDMHVRGLNKNILLVITGEFGRTPKINQNAGRDHWAPLSTLALAGGGLQMGQVIGESASKLDVPRSTPIRPQDLMATVFHVLGIPRTAQYTNTAGRPVYMLESGQPIAELV